MNNFWNERYAEKVFAYGIEPNQFYKEQLAKFFLPPKAKVEMPFMLHSTDLKFQHLIAA
jgi:hypothetical protein